MISKYLEFLNENTKDNNHDTLYWEGAFEKYEILNKDWTDLTITEYKRPIYIITFAIGSDKYDYRHVVFERKGNEDVYYLENQTIIDKFKDKMYQVASNDAAGAISRMKIVPKCLADVESMSKFNM